MALVLRLVSLAVALAALCSGHPFRNVIRNANFPVPTNLIASHFGHFDVSAAYDYIIVGGGTSGLTIARRLAETHTVAVIEAGGFYELESGNYTTIPADASDYLGKNPMIYDPLIDWGIKTTPQAGFAGAAVSYPQGKTFGGSSARNLMNYQRGTNGSYQKWANMVNDQSFTFANLLPYFKKSPQFTPAPASRPADTMPKSNPNDWSPSGGPLQVTYPVFANPASPYVAKAWTDLGFNQTAGVVDGTLIGWGWVPSTMDPDEQCRSSGDSMLVDGIVKDTTFQLDIFDHTLAKKIIFNGNKKATGVQVETGALGGSNSVIYQLNATKEVIVTAGSFRSPQLLMVSGIGPSATLSQQGIPLLVNSPGVGQNMWDQTLCGLTINTNVLTHGWLGNMAFAAQAAAQYNSNRTGILTNPGADILAFEKLPTSLISQSTRNALDNMYPSDWPDVEYLSLDAWSGSLNDYALGAPDVKNYTSIDFVLVAPFSRGNVTINSKDTKDNPVVNPNWLSDPRDLEVAVGAFKRTRSVLASDAIKPIDVGGEANPGPSVSTTAQIQNYVMHNSDSIHHASCTNKMGPSSDKMAVVDTKGRVYGVTGLRVADASIFPLLPPGQPLATVYAIAEKIADNILNGN